MEIQYAFKIGVTPQEREGSMLLPVDESSIRVFIMELNSTNLKYRSEAVDNILVMAVPVERKFPSY